MLTALFVVAVHTGGGVYLGAYGQLGIMLTRFSSSRLYAELRVKQNLTPIHMNDDPYDSSFHKGESTSVYPTELGLQVGVGF